MAPEITSSKPSAFSVFRNPSFTRMWFAQLVSTIGDAFTMIAAGIYVYRLTGSTLQVGLMLMATSVPMMLVGLFAGVFVDRYDRKRIMIMADLLRALFIFLIPILLPYSTIWLYVLIMMTSTVSTFFNPAFESILPETATDEELAAANSMIAISSFGSTAVGFAASGLIAAYSIEWAFYIDALTFLLSALVLLNLKVSPLAAIEETNVATVFRSLRNGLQFLVGDQILRSLLFIGMLYSLSVGIWNTLLLPFATEALGATEFEYGIQEGLTSIGFVAGSLLVARFAERLREGQWIIIGLLGMGVAGLFYALTSSLVVAIVLVTISGIMNAPFGVARRTLVQRHTDREVRGRVFGAQMTVGHILLLIGMAAAGLADVIGVRQMMLLGVALTTLAGLFALVAPGIGRPAADWLRSVRFLRAAAAAPSLEGGRMATPADMDRLIVRLPALSVLSNDDRQRLLKEAWYLEAVEGSVIVRHGEVSDAAYFIVDGRAIAGRVEDGQERVLEVLNAGDFFGEIAALTGLPRTANVVVDRDSSLLRVPASTLRELSGHPDLNRIFMSKMTERMVRMKMIELPKLMSLDQQMLRELRTPEPATATSPG